MKLIPWRSRGELANFRNDIDDVFNRFIDEGFDSKLPAVFARAHIPPVNVSETEKSWAVSVELPGLNEKDIQVQLLGEFLQISAERKWEDEKKGKEFHQVEAQYGTFQRSIRLPDYVRHDAETITASYKRGVLEIAIPKTEPTPAAKIPVKAS
jgi:HSP20 family protein